MEEKVMNRNVRINAMKTLYNIDLMKNPVSTALEHVFEDTVIDDRTKLFVEKILAKEEDIKTVISACLTNYSLNRLSYVDRAIVMIATYEMMNGLAPQIAIDEAIEITKEFSNLDDDKAKAFNNRLLDTIAKYLEHE